MAKLQERGLIINMVDFNPSREMMLEWVMANCTQDLKVEVTQLKVLARFVFLLVLEKAGDRAKILRETPLFMNGKVILAFPWDPSFDVKTTRMMIALV